MHWYGGHLVTIDPRGGWRGDGIAPLRLVLYIFWADLITPQIEITPSESVSL